VLVAVTGATGFVGRHLVSLLLRRGHRVRALVRNVPRAGALESREVELVPGSLDAMTALARLLEGADAAVHLVGIIVESGAATFPAVHVEGTRRLLTAARAAGVQRYIHMSALGARPDESATSYHRTKWQAEELVRGSGLPAAILRPSLISGPESAPIRVLRQLHRWSPVIPIFGDGQFPIQPIWIEDVTLAFALALERADVVGTFELGGPAVLTYEEFVRTIGRAAGQPRPLIHIPLGLVRCVARACDPLGPAAPITSIQLRMLVEGNSTRSNTIETVFGIRPLPFEEGLRRFIR
jgi:NADH dehydrogenase